MFSLICAWTKSRVNNQDTGDLRPHRAHFDATVMKKKHTTTKSNAYVMGYEIRPRVAIMPTLLPLVASQNVVTTTCGATSDNKVDIMTTCCFQYMLCIVGPINQLHAAVGEYPKSKSIILIYNAAHKSIQSCLILIRKFPHRSPDCSAHHLSRASFKTADTVIFQLNKSYGADIETSTAHAQKVKDARNGCRIYHLLTSPTKEIDHN